MHRGMMAFACGIVALGAVAAHGAAADGIALGKPVTFKDWTIGCDNGLACQAVALLPEAQTDGTLSAVVKRAEGVNAPLIVEIASAETKSESYRLLVDGRAVIIGKGQRDSDFITLDGGDAVKLARAMAKGKTLTLADGNSATLGTASLAGASAALRQIDALQGRNGSRGAIVATGKRRATARKAAIPVIMAKKITPSDNLPDAGALVALSEGSPCAAKRFGSTQDTAYSLGTGAAGPQALVLLNCGSGAYNFSSGVYVGTLGGGKWTFAPARFDYAPFRLPENGDLALLVNADWGPGTQTLGGYSKGRGLGDCGSSESYVWDGSMFRLTGATRMEECRGSLDWIPVWRAEVKLTD